MTFGGRWDHLPEEALNEIQAFSHTEVIFHTPFRVATVRDRSSGEKRYSCDRN